MERKVCDIHIVMTEKGGEYSAAAKSEFDGTNFERTILLAMVLEALEIPPGDAVAAAMLAARDNHMKRTTVRIDTSLLDGLTDK